MDATPSRHAMTDARRRRALVVAYHFPPDASIGTMRTLRVVEQLARENWHVTVLTSDQRTYRRGTPVDEALAARVPAGVRVVRARAYRGLEALKTLARSRRNGTAPAASAEPATPPAARSRSALQRLVDVIDGALAIPDHESAWLAPAIAHGLAAGIQQRPDVVYSSAPAWTGQLVAYVMATTFGCRWVADFRDPWGRAPWRGDRFEFAMRAARALEKRVVSRADRIVFVSQANCDEFRSHYGPAVAAKFHVVPNGCDIADFRRVTVAAPAPNDPIVLLHAGSLYAGRTPVPVFRALATALERGIIDRQRFRLRFMGAVALQLTELTRACAELGIADIVEFTPRVPRAQSVEAMMRASGLLLLQPGHAVAVPAKLYEYVAAGRPIFAIAEGETAALVQDSGAGIAVSSDDETAIVDALQQLVTVVDRPISPRFDFCDGALRAAEIAAIVRAVADGAATSVDSGQGRRASAHVGRAHGAGGE